MTKPYSFSVLLMIHLLIYLSDADGKFMNPSFADSNGDGIFTNPSFADTNVYIVYLGETLNNDAKLVTDSHHAMLATLMGSEELASDSMVYSYRYSFSGFAAKLTEAQAQEISQHPDVVKVIPNSFYELQTTRSWEYLGLPHAPETTDSLHYNMGDGVVIGVLDTGIWPESKSFNDEGLSAIPSRWKGICKSGDRFNATKHCNRKLIGARWFVDGLLASFGGRVNLTALGEFLSARDASGHGSHVASTAAGAYVGNVSFHGVGRGTARGGAPRARLAVYKVCWNVQGRGVCTSADIFKAFDEAINDGVDVLTLSLGSSSSLPPPSEVDGSDVIAIGSFYAVARGIPVVCAAGNSGPKTQTVVNTAPWIITVAASTMDRAFSTEITLGNSKIFQGHSIFTGRGLDFTSLFYPGDVVTASGVCEGLPQQGRFAAGKVVLCFTTYDTPAVTTFAASLVRDAGGVGVIVSKPPNEITGDCYDLACAEVDYEIGSKILQYIRSTRNPTVMLSLPKTLVGNAVAAKIVGFSSRGPNTVSASILKPDIAAPGVQIIAATSGVDRTADQGYQMLSGTSMSTPHIAGIVALLRSQHPDWSPAAIRSALTTTAWTKDQYGIPFFAEGDPPKLADPFDFGGGIARPIDAACPGLIYDMDISDYIDYLCSMDYDDAAISRLVGKPVLCPCPEEKISTSDINLPSITIPHLGNSTTVTRTVINVGAVESIYHVVIEPPTGTLVFVYPPVLVFNCFVKKITFKVTVVSMHQLSGGYYFGRLTWSDGVHNNVRIPISVRTGSLGCGVERQFEAHKQEYIVS